MNTLQVVKISLVIPFYNAEAYIEDCLQSLVAQDYPFDAYEIFMIDNNSTDTSAKIAQRYPKVQLLTEKTQSAYAARNCGIVATQGNIIAFTDPDCVPERN